MEIRMNQANLAVAALEDRVERLETLLVALASHFVSTRGVKHPDAHLREQEDRIERLGKELFDEIRQRGAEPSDNS